MAASDISGDGGEEANADSSGEVKFSQMSFQMSVGHLGEDGKCGLQGTGLEE